MPLTRAPTQPLALGLLVALTRQQAAVLPLPELPAKDELSQVLVLRRERAAAFDELSRQRSSHARILGQANQATAEVLPRLGKLKERSDFLRQQQSQAADQAEMQRLRRARAELSVQIQDLQTIVDQQQEEAHQAREKLLVAQAQQMVEGDQLRALDARLGALQALEPPLNEAFARLERALGLAHAQLFVARHEGEAGLASALHQWEQQLRLVIEEVLHLHDALLQGRFPERAAFAAQGGRAFLCAEAVWGLLALGDAAGARLAFGRMCGSAPFLQQIDEVFRVFCAGRLMEGDAGLDELDGWVRVHRWEQSAKGALADTICHLIDGDEVGFTMALRRFLVADWQAAQRLGQPALGLVNLVALGLARMAVARGFVVAAELGPTAPWGVVCTLKALS